MRAPLLLVVVSTVALADATTPPGPSGAARPRLLEYVGPGAGTPTPTWEFTGYAAGDRVVDLTRRQELTIAAALEAAVVDGRHDRWYLATTSEGQKRRVFGADVTPLWFDRDGSFVTVAFGGDFEIHVRVFGAAGAQELVLDPAGQGYLSRRGGSVTAELVDGVAPVPLVKLGSHPEACADYWDLYVSVVDGVPRKALELDGVADPPAFAQTTARFDARAGTALVTERVTEGEHAPVKLLRSRWRWNGRVFERVSKRASTLSK